MICSSKYNQPLQKSSANSHKYGYVIRFVYDVKCSWHNFAHIENILKIHSSAQYNGCCNIYDGTGYIVLPKEANLVREQKWASVMG